MAHAVRAIMEIAYVNGVFGPISEATVSVEDRGFLFGDGIYEVVAAYDGQPFLLAEHMASQQSLCGILIFMVLARHSRIHTPVWLQSSAPDC